MINQFCSTVQKFNTTSFKYAFTNPFTKKQRLPRVVSRYGGKGNFYQDYEQYVYDMAKACKAKTFVDCFGGGGTMSMMALLMTDYDTYTPLFDKVIYNDLDISVYSTFEVVKDEIRCERLVNRILDTKYCRESFKKAHEIVALLNIVDLRTYLDTTDYVFTTKDFAGYMRASQLNQDYLDHILKKRSLSYEQMAVTLAEVRERLIGELTADDVAYYAFIENAMSFNGAGQSYRDVDGYDRCNIDYERKMYLLARKLTNITPLLDRLEVRNTSYKNIIDEQQDNGCLDKCIWFLDPPYYTMERSKSATAVYKNEFNNTDHVTMILMLSALKHWLLCGYKRDEQEGDRGDLSGIAEWQSRIYGVLRNMQDVKFIDLGMKARPSSSKAQQDGDPHEILWLKQ